MLSGVADGATTSETSLTWAFASEPGASFACRVYPAALTPGPFAPCSAAGSHTAAGFAPGVYAFEVRATDAAGNVEAGSAKRTFTVVPAPAAASGSASGLSAASKSAPQIRVNVTFTFKNSTKKQTTLTSLMVPGRPDRRHRLGQGLQEDQRQGRRLPQEAAQKALQGRLDAHHHRLQARHGHRHQDPEDPPAQDPDGLDQMPGPGRRQGHGLLSG